MIGHATFPTTLAGNKIIHITRDPRSWVVSVSRYKEKQNGIVPEKPSEETLEFIIKNRLKYLFGFIGWKYNADLVVKFEDIVQKRPKTFEKIIDVAELNCSIEDISSHVNVESRTYTGKLSSQLDPELEKLFFKYNGLKLMELFGYA